ncbi:MAG TPA: hypothetical protein VEH84_11895 [Alphaproteobacteria bacterium]|nr:hypothetical protein [Alphaproteobacteria bacterium]
MAEPDQGPRGGDLHGRLDQNGRDKGQPDMAHRRHLEQGDYWWQTDKAGHKPDPDQANRHPDDLGNKGV